MIISMYPKKVPERAVVVKGIINLATSFFCLGFKFFP